MSTRGFAFSEHGDEWGGDWFDDGADACAALLAEVTKHDHASSDPETEPHRLNQRQPELTRRIFVVGVTGLALASVGCGLAPDVEALVVARAAQGAGGALLIPASLAILQSSFPAGQRAAAIGAWSGLTGVAAALGPFIGGWLVEVGGWRWVFLINLPVAVLVVVVALRHVPETRGTPGTTRLDLLGAALLAGALGVLTYGLTSWAATDLISIPVVGSFGGALLLFGLLLWRERTTSAPLLPVAAFRSRLFVATNVITLVLYAAFGAILFSLVIALQVGAGLSPMAAGLSLLPITVLMLLFSPAAGRLTERVGPRFPMTVGPVLSAVGVSLLARMGPDPDYVTEVLLGTTVFGAGLTLLVTPLTATVLASLPDSQAGFASGVNNAVARSAGLLAVAATPVMGGLGERGLTDPAPGPRRLQRHREGVRSAAHARSTARGTDRPHHSQPPHTRTHPIGRAQALHAHRTRSASAREPGTETGRLKLEGACCHLGSTSSWPPGRDAHPSAVAARALTSRRTLGQQRLPCAVTPRAAAVCPLPAFRPGYDQIASPRTRPGLP